MNALLRFVLLLCLSAVPVLGAWAHPHVFITAKATFLFDGNTLTGVRQEWLFDEVFGSSVILDYDRDKDKKFSETETKHVKAEAFDNLANYGYFTFLSIDGVRKKDLKINDFTATITGNSVLYAFTIPLAVAAGAKAQTVRLTMYDDEYFVAFDPIHLSDIALSPPDAPATLSMGRGSAKSIYPGQVMPDQVVLSMAAVQ